MKKTLVIIAVVCVAAMCAALLVGCQPENYKADAVATDWQNVSTVTSNNGLAVRAGNYLYYINGYAGNTVDNAFGEVQKGAIYRVELDAAGNPKRETNVCIVPKNVYNTVQTSGLVIRGEYIYYSSPSVDKNSKGEAKTAEMWLMRTKLDGTGTQVIKEFSDYTAVYKITDGYVLYYLNSELHQIDLNAKKFDDKLIADKVTACKFTDYSADAFLNDTAFYVKASEVETDTHNVIWAYRAGGESKSVIVGNSTSYGDSLENAKGYTLSLVQTSLIGNKIRLIYDKTDSGANTKSKGTYSFDFSSDLTFDENKEVRYGYGIQHASLYFLGDNDVIATDASKNVYYLHLDGETVTKEVLIPSDKSATIFEVVPTDTGVDLLYTASSVLYRIHVLDKTEGEYASAIRTASIVFDGKYNTTWLGLDKVGDVIYYFNTDVKDYTYYLNLSAVKDRDVDSRTGKLLSKFTNADTIAMLEGAEEEAAA